MKVCLMYRDRDFNPKSDLPSNAEELMQDLEISTLLKVMSNDDTFVYEVTKRALFTSLREPEAILYRQHILADCLEQADTVRDLYATATEAIEREKRVWRTMIGGRPDGLLSRSVEVLQIFLIFLRRIRHTTDEHGAKFRSEGFTRLFNMFAKELDDEYLRIVGDHLGQLGFRNGLLMSVELGKGNKGVNYVLRKPRNTGHSWKERLQILKDRLPSRDRSNYFFRIDDRDESGFEALSELRGQGISHVASALAQSSDHILGFFKVLQLELGFYIGCLNLHNQLIGKNEPVCFPKPLVAGNAMLSARGLYDVSLSLNLAKRTTGNDVNANGKMLVMITGANQGGKSTFLRSIGLAQLMMQCGLFVPAESFQANICRGIYTHFKREEDTTMKSGKLDEELSRMSSIVDHLSPTSLVLLNESFASTNEREGSEVARQILRALLESGIKVFYVTHMYDLAQGFFCTGAENALFLRAERLGDGRRTFRLVEGEPLPTSFGEDLYQRIFGNDQL